MNVARRITSVTALVALVAMSGFAALSNQYAEWGKGPVQHMMTKAELAKWKTIQTDAEAQAFIDLFWARRDPTPATPENEAKTGFEERVKIADQRYTGRTRGAMTDRGKAFILLGAPTRLRTANTQGGSQVLTPGAAMGSVSTDRSGSTFTPGAGVSDRSPKELWIYEQNKTPVKLDSAVVELAFIDQYSSNEWKLEATPRTNHALLLQRAAEWYVTQPNLTAAPVFTASIPAGAITPTPATSATLSDALRTAIDEVRAGKAQPTRNAFVTYGEFITPDGDYFVPVALYVPKVAGLSKDAKYTFFGLVEKDGAPAVMFEEAATATASGEDFFVDKSLTSLGPGRYKGTFGLAQDGKAVSIVTTDIVVDPLEKDAAGISDLILSTNIYALSQAQSPTDPFAFGGMKVVPKADQAFRKADELWYFFELRNPAMDATTSKPKISVQMNVTGTTADGRAVKMNAPASEMEAQELKGVKGHYAIGASIPLAKFRTGDYTMTLKVTDLASTKTYELKAPFRVVD